MGGEEHIVTNLIIIPRTILAALLCHGNDKRVGLDEALHAQRRWRCARGDPRSFKSSVSEGEESAAHLLCLSRVPRDSLGTLRAPTFTLRTLYLCKAGLAKLDSPPTEQHSSTMKKLNWMLQLLMLLLVCWRVSGQGLGETFGTSLKGIQLPVGKQVLVFSRFCAASERPCLMQHWWSGGSFAQYAETTVRYFVDSEPALVMPLGLAHGMSNEFMDDDGP
eukprot:6181938-Pleurochrysis_carterae.AAC.1